MATVTSSKRHLVLTSDTYESNGDVVVGGNLTINGTTTTLDTANLLVEDKNIIIGNVSSPSDTTANGGGITLKGSNDYTISWSNANDRWEFNQGIYSTTTIVAGSTISGSNLSGTNTGDNSANTHSSMFIDRGDVNVTTTSGGSNNNPFDNAHTETKIAENGARSISYTGASAHLFTSFVGGSASVLQLGAHYNGDDFYMRVRTDGSSWKDWRKLFHENYHPNADKWTTARTLSLTGEVTGSVSWDGSGNASLATTLNNSSLDDQYVTVGSRHSGDGSALSAASKASIRIWDVSAASDDPSGASDGLVLTAGWDSNDWAVQQYHDFHSNDLYLRSKQSGTWMTTWDRVFHDTYHPNADKWTTARTLSLTGDVTGSVSWDGSGNVSITTAVSSSFLRSDAQDAYTPKRIDFGTSSNWDSTPGFTAQTNLHLQGHNHFWLGAGNGTWFTGVANSKSSTAGLAADATAAHDLLITTMQGTATYDRGITFAVDNTGAGTSGYRLGKWHSSNEQHSSKLTVDGGLHVRGGDMANYDYYGDDYSTYWDNQGGQAYWGGDTGWIDPSITAGNAIQIQAGNLTTNTNNPALQFHQYGYGGIQFRYDGPNDVMHLESTGTNRFDYFQVTTDHGYFQMGAMNTSHVHLYTDRASFYSNKPILVNGTTLTGLQTSVSGNAGSVTNGFYTTGDQTASGVKTFSGTLDVSGVAKNVLSQSYVEIYIYGDDDKYYPVTIGGASSHYGYQKYHVSRRYNWTAPSTWNTSTHMGALSLTWEHGSDTAWGGNDKEWRVIQFDEVYTTVCNGLVLAVTEGMVVWLRGGGTGGARYRVSTPQGAGATVKIYDNKTSGASGSGTHVGSTTFTAGDGSTYAVESYSSTNVNNRIKEYWPIRGKTNHYRGQHQIFAAIDEDNMASNSNSRVPTQQSTKAYVDNATSGYLTSSSTQSKYIRSDEADEATERITFRGDDTNSNDTIATSTGSLGSVEIFNNGSGVDAFMAFHVGADFACYFGLDGGTNKLSVGGWSMGANSYEIYHSGNKPSLSALGAQAAGSYLTSETNGFLGDGGNASTHPGSSRLIYSGQVSAGSGVLGMPTANNANAFINLNKHNGEYNSQLGFSSNGNVYYRNFNNAAINSTQAWRLFAIRESNGDLRFNDSEMILLGSSTSNPSQDARIFHNGTDTYFENFTGELRLMSNTWALRSLSSEILSYNTTDDVIKSTAKALQLGNGSIGSDNARLILKRIDTASADDIQFFNGTTRVGEIGVKDTTWLRINQTTAKNIFTPRYIRADGGFFVDSTSKGINGSGNFIGGTITGASDANVSNWNTAYTHSQSAHAPSNAQANVINYISTSGSNNYLKLGSDDRGTTVPHQGEIVYLGTSNDEITSRAYVSDLPFIRNNADDTFTGKLSVGSSSSRRAGMYGIYNSGLIGHIWSMGTAYHLPQNGANFGNLYGLAYKHTNNSTGGTMAGGHQMVWCQNGTGKSAMGTNIWTSGSYTGASISVTGSASLVTSGTGTLTCGGAGIFGGSGTGDVYVGNFGSGNYARFHTNNSNTYFDMNCGVVYWRQSSSTRFQNNMTNGTFTASGDVVAYGSPSDVRLKENIKPIESALDKVSRLQGVTFDWKQSDSILNIKEDVGFIAQDVQKVVPELVRENEDGMLSMRHQGIAPILLEAIKELKAEIEELKKCNKCNNCNCKTNNDGGTK